MTPTPRILVVDDEPNMRTILRGLLRREGYEVLEATDGRGRRRDDLGPGTAMQLPMDPIYGVDGEPSLGVGVLPHGSGIKNLCFASRLTLPGLGLEGEFASGTIAAGMVAAPAKSPFSRSPLLSRA
ncbi:MAG: response regulator [Myxococcales bacterium]|nr:response regulator [Myxococcales bacterium]